MHLRDRYEGCMLGLACGDALGAPAEFRERGSFVPVESMRDGGKFAVAKGQWTDDTSMALCLAMSLLECGGFDPLDQMEKYYQWATTGYLSSRECAFGIGKTIGNALALYHKTKQPYCGCNRPRSAGNGALMRLAPVPLYFFPDKDRVEHFAVESARTTHAAEECLQANRIFSRMLWMALKGKEKTDILLSCGRDANQVLPGLRSVVAGEYRDKAEEEINSTGYVTHTLEAALWCFWKTDNFEEAVLNAVNLGGDADTVGAVCGQLAGAFYGCQAIPAAWVEDLTKSGLIRETADNLFAASGNGNNTEVPNE